MGKLVPKRPLRVGSKQYFVAERFDQEPEEILTAAQAANVVLTREQVIKIKSYLRHVRGITKPVKPGEAPVTNGQSRKPPAAKKPKESGMSPKEAQLRKLIFELGFDAARHVFEEFERLHQTMRG